MFYRFTFSCPQLCFPASLSCDTICQLLDHNRRISLRATLHGDWTPRVLPWWSSWECKIIFSTFCGQETFSNRPVDHNSKSKQEKIANFYNNPKWCNLLNLHWVLTNQYFEVPCIWHRFGLACTGHSPEKRLKHNLEKTEDFAILH